MKFNDLSGCRFGKLFVIKRASNSNSGKTAYLCRCDCGREVVVRNDALKSGNTKTCGCGKINGQGNRTHGKSNTRMYGIWTNMKKRCEDPGATRYKDWGGRGVSVCERWHSFEAFYNDMKDGYADHLTIDRINNDGDYEPSNCRWATYREQNQNKTRKSAGTGGNE